MAIPVNLAPEEPVIIGLAPNASNVPTTAKLSVKVADREKRTLDVTFYGRPVQAGAAEPDFTLVVIPDPQYYALMYPAILRTQMEWVVNNRSGSNIPYVANLGDNVEAPADPAQWMNADAGWRILDSANIPYGIAAGNHDGAPFDTGNFNAYFGMSRFQGRPYYGGHYGNDNDNHFDLFSVSGLNFIVIYIEFDNGMTSSGHPVLKWANTLLQNYRDRRAIVISHNVLQGQTSNAFTSQGQAIYNALKGNPNLFLIMGGHLDVAARRTDRPGGNTIYTLRSDYQYVDSQRSGYLRLMRFSPADDMIYVSTYSPTQKKHYDHPDTPQNHFNLSYAMEGTAYQVIGTANGVANGGTASISWSKLEASKQYEWFAIASDGTYETASDTWRFTTAGGNVAPVANNQAVSGSEDVPLPITLTATGANANPLSYSIITVPAHGSLGGVAPNLIYTPSTDYAGADSFTFKVNDGTTDSNPATVTIAINAVNDAPLCADLNIPTSVNQVGQVVPACTDKEGNSLTYAVVDQPGHGTASIVDGKLQYAPQAGYSGTDSFTYKAHDGVTDSNIAIINVNISDNNQPPTADNQSVTTAEDTALEIRLTGNDPEQSPLIYILVSNPAHGSFNGTTYVPAANFYGSDSFTFQTNDGVLKSNIATIMITVNPMNDAPVAVVDTYHTESNLILAVPVPGVLVNDGDIEGGGLPVTLVNSVSNGSLVLNSDGSFIYTPNADFTGEDTFTYQISDPEGAISAGTVTIKVGK